MHPLELLLAWLFATDLIWGAIVILWLIIGFPIAYLIERKRENRK